MRCAAQPDELDDRTVAELLEQGGFALRRFRRSEAEVGTGEVPIESERALQSVLLHESERDAIGEAHSLIGDLVEYPQGRCLFVGCRAENRHRRGVADRAAAFGGERMECQTTIVGSRTVATLLWVRFCGICCRSCSVLVTYLPDSLRTMSISASASKSRSTVRCVSPA